MRPSLLNACFLVLFSAMLAAGLSLGSGISWLSAVERVGVGLERLWYSIQGTFFAWQDRKAGKEVAQQREEVVQTKRRKEEAGREKERKRREQAIAKAEAALEEAKRNHETNVEEIRRDRAALDRRAEAEDARWEKQKEELETALRRARE